MLSGQRSLLLVFTVCASLCARCPVDGFISGAPPESCDTMRAVHEGSTSFSDCAVPSLCPTITIDGVSIMNNVFQYDCRQSYTFLFNGHSSSLRGFMVEFRTSSNSTTFDGSLSHVGEFAIASGYADTTRLECGGHAVTQTKINTDGRTSFVWTSPGVGQQERAQLWYTQVTSSRADFLPRKGVVGVPSEVSCNCPANTYLVVRQTTPTYQSECVQCPENSTSERGISQICPCSEGFGRETGMNASSPCVGCFSTRPTDLTVISSQRPNVIISWTAPTNIDGWDVLYRVTVDDGRMNMTAVEGSSLTMLTLPNLLPRTNYTLHVFAYTESGCLSNPASVDITVLERCPDNPPNITQVAQVPGEVGLQYTHPQTTDPMISESDFRYAVYYRCGSDSNFTLAGNGIQDTIYNILDLPVQTTCTARVLVYSVDCPLIFPRLSVDETFVTKAAAAGNVTPQVTSGGGNLVITIIPEPGIPLYRCVYRTGRTRMVIERNSTDLAGWAVDLVPGTYTVQCAGVNVDGFVGPFSSLQMVTVSEPQPPPPSLDLVSTIVLAVMVSVGVVLVIVLVSVFACSLFVCLNQRKRAVYQTAGNNNNRLWAESPTKETTFENTCAQEGQEHSGGGQGGKSVENTPEKKKKLCVDEKTAAMTVYNPFASEEEKRLSKVDPDALENGTTTDSTPAVVTSVTPLIEGNEGETSMPMTSFHVSTPAEVNEEGD